MLAATRVNYRCVLKLLWRCGYLLAENYINFSLYAYSGKKGIVRQGMQNTPSQSPKPSRPYSPQRKSTPPLSPASPKPSTKKRTLKNIFWKRVPVVVGAIASLVAIIIGILQLFGFQTVGSLINHPTSAPTPIPIYTYSGHGGWVGSISWSPDSERITSSGEDGTVQIWNATTGENAHILPLSAEDIGPQGPGAAVAWSPDGKYIAITTSVEVLILDAVTDTIVQRHVVHSDPYPDDIISSSWSPDSRYIVYSSYETIHMWNITSGQDIRIYTNQNQESIFSLAWSPDGKLIASTDGNLVHVWNAVNGSLVFTYNSQSDFISSLAWSQNSQYIASSEYLASNNVAQKLEVWNAFDGYPYGVSNRSDYYFPDNITCNNQILVNRWSPNNSYLLYTCRGSSKNTINVWNFPAHKLITLISTSNTILDVEWSPNEEYLAIASGSTVQVWRVADLLRS